MNRLAPDATTGTKLEHADEQDQPLMDSGRGSQESDIELSELLDYQDGDGDNLAGERTPTSHYPARSPDGPPPKKSVPAWKIALTLAACVLGFTINTEATAYIEDELGYKKPIATMYLTHSSLALPWIAHMLYLRYNNRHVSYVQWLRDYHDQLRGSIAAIDAFATRGRQMAIKGPGRTRGPLDFLATSMAIVTVVLTASGFSWFTSLSLTTPADLTAIYNCSTFFAAAFSVPILKEKMGWISILAVGLSIAGTFTIAYGDTTADHSDDTESDHSGIGGSRLLGNIIACVGAVAFGLYEVLFKKWACSNRPETQESSLPLTLAASALTGFYTFGVVWIALIIFHILGIESFAIPTTYEWLWLAISVISGVIGITLLVVLVIWTDPVFGSMANVLSVFFVALADWLVWDLTPSVATYIGGGLIFVAFGMLAYDTLGDEKH